MERNREITVKGIGNLKAPVDCVVLTLSLEEVNKDYEAGYADFEKHICNLQEAVISAGFQKADLKTKEISVSTKYDTIKKNGDYVEVFLGYQFTNNLSLEFDFDAQKLGTVLQFIGKSGVTPKINVKFSVKDKEAVKNSLLANAAKDAKIKASVLCEAMGVKLGQLLTIQYDWDEIIINSSARYEYDCKPMVACGAVSGSFIDFTPDDIDLKDEACFIWAIEG